MAEWPGERLEQLGGAGQLHERLRGFFDAKRGAGNSAGNAICL